MIMIIIIGIRIKKERKGINSAAIRVEMIYADIVSYNETSSNKIPTLEETLQLCSGRISLDIELKESGYEESIVALAQQYFKRENLLFTSFNRSSLELLNKFEEKVLTGFLFQKPIRIKSIPKFVDFILPNRTLCKKWYLNKLVNIGKPIIIWTVDKSKLKKRFITENIFGLITNDPS